MRTQYRVIKPEALPRGLIEISGDRNLTANLDAFGPGPFNENVAEMQRPYSHPDPNMRGIIRFREPTTAESISIAAYYIGGIAKPWILDPTWLQLGRIVRTSEGVFANPPKDAQGNPVTDEQTLKSYLSRAKPIQVGKGKIYIVPDTGNLRDFGFADYDSFVQGTQDEREFTEEGLAKILEHSRSARNLGELASKKFYPRGINYVLGFGPVKEPVLRGASLFSYRSLVDGRLDVYGNYRDGDAGYAFGVLDDSEKA